MSDESLTNKIYQALVDGLKTGVDWTHFTAKYGGSKGPLYNAFAQFQRDMEAKVNAFGEVQSKLGAVGLKLEEAGRTLDELDRRIKEAEGSLAPLEETKNALNEGIEALETKLTEKSELLEHAGELGKLGLDIDRLRQLREVLTEIGAKSGLKGKEAVSKFFAELKDYDAIQGFTQELQRIESIIRTKTLRAEKWREEEEAARRKHDNLKEAIGAIYALRAKGVKDSQIITWQQVLNQVESVEQFDEHLRQYRDMTKLLNVRKEELAACQLRLTKAKSQVQTLEKERARIEAAIESIRVAGVKELGAMTEATEKQLKTVAASEIKQAQDVAQEIRSEFNAFLTQLDRLAEKAVHLGEELERTKQELQKYEGVGNVLESHAVAVEAENESVSKQS